MPENTIYVGRPTKWGNPFVLGWHDIDGKKILCDRKMALDLYGIYIKRMIKSDPGKYNLNELKGKNLACWCFLDQPCHADILLKLANKT